MSSIPKDQNIYIYSGPGADPFSAAQMQRGIQEVMSKEYQERVILIENPEEFTGKCLTKGSILVVPGGSAFGISTSLNENGLRKIESFVLGGKGAYLGVCAGAYLANSYRYNVPISGPSCLFTGASLHFSNSKLDGPAVSYSEEAVASFGSRRCSLMPQDAQVVRISTKSGLRNLSTICFGGGVYRQPAKGEDILASYTSDNVVENWDSSSQHAAILQPAENIILSNVHLEQDISQDSVREFFPHFTEKEKKELYASNVDRQKVLASLLQSLGAKVKVFDAAEKPKIAKLAQVVKEEESYRSSSNWTSKIEQGIRSLSLRSLSLASPYSFKVIDKSNIDKSKNLHAKQVKDAVED